MRLAPIALTASLIGFSSLAYAGEADAPALCAMHSDEAPGAVRVLGHLNVNTATREQLALVPALDAAQVDALLEARARGPVTTLAAFDLADEALDRLTTPGPSTLRRIRALPLEVYAPSRRTAAVVH